MVTTSLNNIATLSALWTLMFMLFSGGFALSTMSKSAPQTSPLGDMLSQKVAATGGSNSLSLNSNSNSNNSPFKSNFLRKLSQQSRNVEENEISSSSNMNSHHNININNHNSINNNNNNNNENESDQPPIVSNSNNSNNDQDILEHNGDEPGGGGGGGGGGGSDIISNDDSVFGNTGETFIDFGNRRTNELKNANKILFDKSMTQCPYSPSSPLAVGGEDVVSLSSNTEQQLLANDVDDEMSKRSSEVELNLNNEECVLASVTFDTMPMPDKTSDKLFMLDTYTVGILSSFDSSLRLYNLNVYARTFSLVRAKHFRGLDVPYDACADKFKHIYIVFPDVNKIAKYALNSTSSSSSSSSRSNRTQQMLIRELISVRDADFSPSTIACHDDLIYVGERIKNHIRVYDRLLRLVRIISLKGVIVSNHVALGVNQNVRVLMDGLDGLALWQVPSPTDNQQHQPSLSSSSSSSSSSVHHVKSSSSHHSHHRKKFTLHPEGNKATLCHFYTRMSCLDDVSVSVETPSNVLEEDDSTSSSSASTRSNIYVTDSCANEVRKFVFERGHKIVDESAYQFSHADGMPISAVANPLGHLFVLTDLPRRLLVIDQRECIASSDHHTHS